MESGGADSKGNQGSTQLPPPEAFSFACAGWLKMYYFGVASALLKAQLHRQAHFAGASAGSLVAASLMLELDLNEIRQFALSCVEKCHGSFSQAFQCHKFVEEIIDRAVMNEEGDIVQQLNHRLNVAVTTLPWAKHKNYTEFENNEKLKKILLASCCCPPIAGFPFQLDGSWVIDGGLAAFQPLVPGKKNVTVSVFYFSKADIKPSRYLPIWWAMYPPRVEDFEWVFDLGFNDTVDWIDKHYPHLMDNPKLAPNFESPTKHPSLLLPEEAEAAKERIIRRQLSESWPYHHSGEEESFARFFGYRSVLKVIPSTALDIILLALVYFVIKPLVWVAVYSEVALHGWLQLSRAVYSQLPLVRCDVTYRESIARSRACFTMLCCPQLFLRSFPVLTRFANTSRLDPFLAEASTVFRFSMHLF